MGSNFLAALLVMAVITLFRALRAKNKQRTQAAQHVYSREADLAYVQRLTGDAMNRLKSRELEWLMLEDFEFRTRISSPQKAPLSVIQGELQACLSEMLVHLHMLPDIRLQVTDKPELVNQGTAMGTFRGTDIQVLVQPGFPPDLIAAALCHECTHYFMHYLRIDSMDADLNEGLTEVTACLIGFSNIMIRAVANRNLPYLIPPEFKEARRLLLAERQKLKNSQQAEKQLQTARGQLRNHITGAYDMLQHTQGMLAACKPTYGRLSKAQMREMQRTMLSLENGSFTAQLKQAEKAESGNTAQVLAADRTVLNICAALFQVLQVIQASQSP